MNFDEAFTRLIGSEGGYVNDPNDPGGETKFGISKRSYPDEDIANMTLERAKAIYLRDFWSPLGSTPDAIKFQVFDFAVQSGMQTAIRKLQSAVGAADDGHWGPASTAALEKMSVTDVLVLFLAQRLRFLTKCRVWQTMSAGLANRIATDLEFVAKDT